MKIAAITHVYNEAVNLPIWVEHYGNICGRENLYVFDHGSDDGSASGLGPVNVLRVEHTPFDDAKKSVVLSALHLAVLQHADCVIVTDCDEMIVADPERYQSVRDYIERNRPTVAACVGLHIHHVISREPPIDLAKPILSQRRLARFAVAACKPMISSAPTKWLPGAHGCSHRAAFDPDLFVFHIKFVDYSVSTRRQMLNNANPFAQSQEGRGAHHKHALDKYVRDAFLVPVDIVNRNLVTPFDFTKEIALMQGNAVEKSGNFFFGEAPTKFVEIPERFKICF